MNNELKKSFLGKKTYYGSCYDSKLLFPVPREINRRNIGLSDTLPFHGWDIWNCYELSWLDNSGKPVVIIAGFIFPCDSVNLIESKSFKLYLNSFNNNKFVSAKEVNEIIKKDLSAVSASDVSIIFYDENKAATNINKFSGVCLDSLNIKTDVYKVKPGLLRTESEKIVEESLYSNLLKSNCPVTGQPDWGTVQIHYKGRKISHEHLLKYIISYRNHTEFHENCVERIFTDIQKNCSPEILSVYARYTRRGGLDINPFRTNDKSVVSPPPNSRLFRQ